jgi:hypothetical protein
MEHGGLSPDLVETARDSKHCGDPRAPYPPDPLTPRGPPAACKDLLIPLLHRYKHEL